MSERRGVIYEAQRLLQWLWRRPCGLFVVGVLLLVIGLMADGAIASTISAIPRRFIWSPWRDWVLRHFQVLRIALVWIGAALILFAYVRIIVGILRRSDNAPQTHLSTRENPPP